MLIKYVGLRKNTFLSKKVDPYLAFSTDDNTQTAIFQFFSKSEL